MVNAADEKRADFAGETSRLRLLKSDAGTDNDEVAGEGEEAAIVELRRSE